MATDATLAPTRRLTIAAIAFAVGFGVHGLDHQRRGMAASPTEVVIGGLVQGVFVAVAVLLVLRHHRRAPEFAVFVGFGSAALFVYAHILPTFLPALQDSFVTGPRINVTWFSWLSAVAEIGTALVFGYVGRQSLRVEAKAGGPT
ncbi:MAG: hypothetical protein QOE94_1828 [Mycobacterium sp.]|nr:hypothetical protein [Mycobacterium sp.]